MTHAQDDGIVVVGGREGKIRDHLIPNEVYGLSEMDLRFADLAPEFHMDYVLPRRPVQRVEGP